MERDERRAAVAVQREMAARGLSQRQLARDAAIDPATLGDFLRGGRWPQMGTRNKLEVALGFDVGSLELIAEGGADDEAPMTTSSEIADVSTPTGRAVMALIPGTTEEERRQIAVALLTWPRGE